MEVCISSASPAGRLSAVQQKSWPLSPCTSHRLLHHPTLADNILGSIEAFYFSRMMSPEILSPTLVGLNTQSPAISSPRLPSPPELREQVLHILQAPDRRNTSLISVLTFHHSHLVATVSLSPSLCSHLPLIPKMFSAATSLSDHLSH